MSEFYVYALLDTRKPSLWKKGEYEFLHEPSYIGHGKGSRDTWHLLLSAQSFDSNKLKVNIANAIRREGYEPLVIRFKETLTKEEAAIEEQKAITTIGIL